ncbi:hypothetical protein [Dyella nitratireducens]|uniref:Uncharacterized protein n=1 Tax=Dyella nitratireducens TaxID=1849580 RepID=A0ABQ1GX36_9GAMM|nr:hypothetical protein [Dyella nitratireducens]GGA51881.1 hypothetical protein GCM10010981_46640 [Dyella nitratireducens]GLQ41645.1 hypothetical protein GCM10007902_14950 [Dyella nitratireducens]
MNTIDWPEVNCLIEALEMLVSKHRSILADTSIDEDTRSDHANDLAYVEILLHKYQQVRDQVAAAQ